MTRRSRKSTAAGLGKVNRSDSSPRPHAPSRSSGILQMGSPRPPKGLLTRLLSRVPSIPPERSPSGPRTTLPRPRFSSRPLAHLQPWTPSRFMMMSPRPECPQPRTLQPSETDSPQTVWPQPRLPGPQSVAPPGALSYGTSPPNPLHLLGSSPSSLSRRFRP